MEQHIRRLGQEAALEANVVGLHEKLLDYLGRLHFRTSYSQNVLRHSLEVAYLTGLLAEEIGLNGPLGRRCGLLHDIGKAADHEMEGGHPAVGAELARRYGESKEVIHAALGHHDDLRVETPYTVLVAAADAISASRPGARRETLEKYVRRLEELEALALGFPGVEQAYAIQAGREIRVLVDSQQLDDAESAKLCRDIAQSIQSRLTYPGEVKVTVLRETADRRIRPMSDEAAFPCRRNDPNALIEPDSSHQTEWPRSKILFIGDVVGAPGRKIVGQVLPRLIPRWGLGLVVCNAENAAGGSGLTLHCHEELVEAGVDVMTMGDHVYRKDEIFQVFDRTASVLRPANFPPIRPGPELALVAGPRRHDGRRLHRAGPDLHEAGRLPVPGRRPHARADRRATRGSSSSTSTPRRPATSSSWAATSTAASRPCSARTPTSPPPTSRSSSTAPPIRPTSA